MDWTLKLAYGLTSHQQAQTGTPGKERAIASSRLGQNPLQACWFLLRGATNGTSAGFSRLFGLKGSSHVENVGDFINL